MAFKDGLLGIKAPHNIGIFLERRKRKKDFFVVVVTIKGTKELKPDHVSGRKFTVSVDPSTPEAELVARLKSLIPEAESGALDEVQAEEGRLEERQVWERLVNKGDTPRTVDDWAGLLYEGNASKGDRRRLQEMFEKCRRPGLGFFAQAGRGLWLPISVDAMKTFQRTMEAVGRLRKSLLRIEQVDDDSGETWERLVGLDPEVASLDDEARGLLTEVSKHMEAAILHDRWPDDVTAPGCPVHTLMGRNYHRSLEHLAQDWTAVIAASRSSILLQFLVDTRHLSVKDAIRLVARRRVLASTGFTWERDPSVEARAAEWEEPSVQAERDPSILTPRTDLRELETYTIDPPDAKDFDDAVSIADLPDGGTRLWVHIADVSHYVQKDDALDRYARDRATSVYLPTGVLPMLPSRLSDNLCSLVEAVDRLALTMQMDIDAEGHVVAARPMESVIRVDRNFAYHDVDGAIERNESPFSSLNDLANRMRATRRGLAIETGELRIRFADDLVEHLDEHGAGTAIGLQIQIKHSSPATRMIEMFMVAANEAVSRFVADRGLAVPYRCHPLPERAKAERFAAQAKVMGVDIALDLPSDDPGTTDDDNEHDGGGPSILEQLAAGKLQLGGFAASETVGSKRAEPEDEGDESPDEAPPPALRGLAQLSETEREAWLAPFRTALAVLSTIPDDTLRELANMKLLGTLGRAFYTPRNMGHFGLGSASYAHFTSPIRRYPDLVLHRQLRWALRHEAGMDVPSEPPHNAEHLEALTSHCSAQAEAAERLERDLLACCMTFESRREEWCGDLRAIVNGVTPGGIFLSLPGELEARLSMRDLPGGPYEADEHGAYLFRSMLPGGRSRAADDPEDAARLTELPWRDLEDPDTGELREIRARLGDKVSVRIRERDFVEGRVAVRLAGSL